MQTLRNKGVKRFFAQVCRRHIEVAQKDKEIHHQMVTTEAQWREKHQPSRARKRVTRAFQQRCCFFAVTSVTHGAKVGGKTTNF